MQTLHLFVKNCTISRKETGLRCFSVHKTNIQVISDHAIFLRGKFNLEVEEENKKLPNIYWTPNLHKHTSKVRFIIAALQCYVNYLSKAFTLVCKHRYMQIETYSSKMH